MTIEEIQPEQVFDFTSIHPDDKNEPLLRETTARWCMFPIKYNSIWEYYKKAEASFWTGKSSMCVKYCSLVGHFVVFNLPSLSPLGTCVLRIVTSWPQPWAQRIIHTLFIMLEAFLFVRLVLARLTVTHVPVPALVGNCLTFLLF